MRIFNITYLEGFSLTGDRGGISSGVDVFRSLSQMSQRAITAAFTDRLNCPDCRLAGFGTNSRNDSRLPIYLLHEIGHWRFVERLYQRLVQFIGAFFLSKDVFNKRYDIMILSL